MNRSIFFPNVGKGFTPTAPCVEMVTSDSQSSGFHWVNFRFQFLRSGHSQISLFGLAHSFFVSYLLRPRGAILAWRIQSCFYGVVSDSCCDAKRWCAENCSLQNDFSRNSLESREPQKLTRNYHSIIVHKKFLFSIRETHPLASDFRPSSVEFTSKKDREIV